jgi:TolB-like protein/class 3 adenylate cyclase/Flp pilus assembly protein TadD
MLCCFFPARIWSNPFVPSENTEQRKLAAIMFTDMVGYSALSQRNEALSLELLAENQRLLRTQFPLFNGREVKTTGDGFLVEFPSALQATQCAVEIQRAVVARNSTQPAERHIHVRIGIHVGDVVHREADMYGDGVNIAARIEPLAIGGGICLSDTVYAQVRNKLDVGLTKLNSPELKHIEVPMDVYRVVLPWQQQAPVAGKSASPSPSKPSARPVAVGLIVALALGVGWWLLHQPGQTAKQAANPQTNTPGSPAAATPSATDQKSIAVLAFANLSEDKGNEYFSDGISEELLNVLAKTPGLKVTARTSAFYFKGKQVPVAEIAQQLGVAYVVEGSVRKAGDKVRITAQLIKAADGFHLWSETYDRNMTMTNIFAIQSDIAERVVEALKVQLLGAVTQQKKPTESIEAYQLFLQGRNSWNRRTDESLKQAVEYFNQAIERDPGYALAYAGLADCHVLLPLYAGTPPREAMPKASAAALKALELDSRLAEPHAALAYAKALFEWDWRGAEAEFRRAIALSPNYATAHHWLAATVLRALGRLDESLAELQRAQALDPLSPIINAELGEALQLAGKADLGIQILRKQIAPDSAFFLGRMYLGQDYLATGRLPEALAELEPLRRLGGSATYPLGLLGLAYARTGRTSEARTILAQLLELQRQGLDGRVGIAVALHGLGDDEGAQASLEQAVEEKSVWLWMVSYHPLWKDLRPHPRVQAILRRMNLVK